MTEPEWLTGDNPRHLLDFLVGRQVSGRKLRLFAVARCRVAVRVRDPLKSAERSAAARVAERFADGDATKEELSLGRQPTRNFWIVADPSDVAAAAIGLARDPAHFQAPVHIRLLREVFGNPFRKAKFATAWRTPTVKSLAAAAYDERLEGSFDLDPLRLSILADALEDAGCRDEPILSHLRSAGPHVRGCWALDLCLNRQ